MNFLGPLPCGDYLMVVIDEYSRFPEVEIVTSTSARSTILKLDEIFARQGIPEVLKSDNGPPFNGVELENFAEHLGFQHCKITPLWPRGNGEAERFMLTLEKCVRTATIKHQLETRAQQISTAVSGDTSLDYWHPTMRST